MNLAQAHNEIARLCRIKPDKLEDALMHIEKLKSAINDALDVFTARESRLEEDVREAEDRAVDAKESIASVLKDYCMELARIRQKMKAGRIEDAIYDLDKVLQEADPDCKARATAVAVML